VVPQFVWQQGVSFADVVERARSSNTLSKSHLGGGIKFDHKIRLNGFCFIYTKG
jgi:hypothetical protein